MLGLKVLLMFEDARQYLLENLANLLVWAADDPSSFFAALFLSISPLLLISALLSWKLHNAIIAERKVCLFPCRWFSLCNNNCIVP
ncbi:unnamed protein product [Toxocara canis]|uniref:Small integral membrane protein 15 n=1 Tax=Toxocara canis TaxID=6265 RepID=A0A183U457_TOXCA|nr:unnamed protein product [Toxocara canis]